jgi:hypothetical protein
MSKKCPKCNKNVYPADPQLNLDGLIFHMACARCEEPGCNAQLNLQNYTMDKKADGTVNLMCKTHYKMHFQKSGGVYKHGADRFRKSTTGELRSSTAEAINGMESLSVKEETSDGASSKEAASTPLVKATPRPEPVLVKASVVPEKDTDYKLERSVTTPDRRPSLSAAATVFGTAEKEAEEGDSDAKVPEFVRRRSSLRKSVNQAVLEEIATTAHEEANFQSPLAGIKSTGGEGGESTSGCGDASCTCENCSCAPGECKCAAKSTTEGEEGTAAT